ncbi:hypothetical protein [Actinophytocola sp.]|uniref:hypothetical protein n=1 Tax=Actinophytocola sp. TaxID=1872138 RepID=UPI003D6BAF4B
MTFWDQVRSTWNATVESADRAVAAPSVHLKPMFRFSLYRPKVPIVVTGDRGAGKSLMYDAIVGKVGTTYAPPGKSDDAEPHKIVLSTSSKRVRCAMVVVPGQDSREREDALEPMMTGGAFPTGLVHVTCYGHNTVWDSRDRRTVGDDFALREGTLTAESLRQRNLEQEAEEFEKVCAMLRDAWHRKSDVWLIIAVAKCDLYWSRIDKARDHYLPGAADSRFAAALRGLVAHVGESNFAGLAVLPLSCYPDSHEFHPTLPMARPELDQRQATVLVNRFRSVLGDFCGRR